uniref:Uncharacterized protein n=1 Tax=Streptomyces sp. NBC_00093 TaxID=2975649 RepID=A0AAU2AHM1_9ACTN
MPQPTRRAPNTAAAKEALHRALRLLDDQERPDALDRAREAARAAVDAVPYPWRAPHCTEFRRRSKEKTCSNHACTRCAAVKAGDPMPVDDW